MFAQISCIFSLKECRCKRTLLVFCCQTALATLHPAVSIIACQCRQYHHQLARLLPCWRSKNLIKESTLSRLTIVTVREQEGPKWGWARNAHCVPYHSPCKTVNIFKEQNVSTVKTVQDSRKAPNGVDHVRYIVSQTSWFIYCPLSRSVMTEGQDTKKHSFTFSRLFKQAHEPI